jgi:hypothetical protein
MCGRLSYRVFDRSPFSGSVREHSERARMEMQREGLL